MRVAISGATGFLGSHLVRRFLADGHSVAALARSFEKASQLPEAADAVIGDIGDDEAVARLVDRAEIVIHTVSNFRVASGPPDSYRRINVEGTRNILEAAFGANASRFVHCSTIGVHGDVKEIPADEDTPFNPGDIYQETKLAAELEAKAAFEAGLPGVVFRPAGIFGPGDLRFLKLFKAVHNRSFRMFGSGETLWHPVYIDDLVDGILLCGEHPHALGRTYILAGDRYVTLNELVGRMAAALGVPPPGRHLPFWPLAAGAAVCETLFRPFGIDPPLHRRRVAFFVKHRAFSIERARRELGYAPGVPLDEGLRRTAAWYFDHGHLARHAA